MNTLVERWRSDTDTFHLPNKECIVKLEDVWCILKIMIYGAQVEYDVDQQAIYMARLLGEDQLPIIDGSRLTCNPMLGKCMKSLLLFLD